MALKGNLRDIHLTQILNLVNLAKKTGNLQVQGEDKTTWLFFQDGDLVCSQHAEDNGNLLSILRKSNRLSPTQLRLVEGRARDINDKAVGLSLINAGYFSRRDILDCLKDHYTELAQQVLTWTEGVFEFENDEPHPLEKIPVRIELKNIIIEGARRMQEWEQLQDEIPSLEMALKFRERPGTDVHNLNFSMEEWRVISYVNPKNTIQKIARTTNLNDLEIRRIVYTLLQAGVVEMIRPEGIPQPHPPDHRIAFSLPGANKDEQKSLVNRIIDRIRAL